MSPLVQGRGLLKPRNLGRHGQLLFVAPRAGAWIETLPREAKSIKRVALRAGVLRRQALLRRRPQPCRSCRHNQPSSLITLNKFETVGQAASEDAKVISLPLYLDRISAGFPSPADDYIEAELDLNRYMIRNPPDTFMVRGTNDALAGAGILQGYSHRGSVHRP